MIGGMILDAEVRYPTPEEVAAYHAAVMGVSQVDARDGVRDWNLLLSALNRPRAAAYYEGADLTRQATTLLWGLVENPPFHDGNKRTAWVTAEAFLRSNGQRVTATDDQIFPVVIAIAQGMALDEADAWLREHVVAMS
jgi:death-on-curing protein